MRNMKKYERLDGRNKTDRGRDRVGPGGDV